jgi:hypothetical protein
VLGEERKVAPRAEVLPEAIEGGHLGRKGVAGGGGRGVAAAAGEVGRGRAERLRKAEQVGSWRELQAEAASPPRRASRQCRARAGWTARRIWPASRTARRKCGKSSCPCGRPAAGPATHTPAGEARGREGPGATAGDAHVVKVVHGVKGAAAVRVAQQLPRRAEQLELAVLLLALALALLAAVAVGRLDAGLGLLLCRARRLRVATSSSLGRPEAGSWGQRKLPS